MWKNYQVKIYRYLLYVCHNVCDVMKFVSKEDA